MNINPYLVIMQVKIMDICMYDWMPNKARKVIIKHYFLVNVFGSLFSLIQLRMETEVYSPLRTLAIMGHHNHILFAALNVIRLFVIVPKPHSTFHLLKHAR